MTRTKGSKNRPKTNITKDYASQIAEKQESITSLTAEIASIIANIDTLKADLKEKKTALGVSNPFTFVLAFVGAQGLIEAVVCFILAGAISRALSAALHRI